MTFSCNINILFTFSVCVLPTLGVRVREELHGSKVCETQLQRVTAEVIRVIGGHVVHTPTFPLRPLHTRHAR